MGLLLIDPAKGFSCETQRAQLMWTKISKRESLHTSRSGLWTRRGEKKSTSTMSIFGLANFANPSTRTYFSKHPLTPLTEELWRRMLTPAGKNAASSVDCMHWYEQGQNNVNGAGCLKLFIFGEYKKYFCDQINIIHTASNHKTNAVC